MRRWTKRIVIVLAVFVLPVAGFYFYARWQGERELRAAIAELDATGEPWRWDDLRASRHPLDDNDDIRDIVYNAIRLVPGKFENWHARDWTLDRSAVAALAPEEWQTFDEHVQLLRSAFAEAQKLCELPKGRIRIRTDGADINKLRHLASVLHYGVAWHAQLGELDDAAADCLAALRLSDSLQDEFELTSHLVRNVLLAIAVMCIERTVAQGQPSPAHLQQLQERLVEFDYERALVHALRGHRADLHRTFAGLSEGRLTALSLQPFRAKGTPIGESFLEHYYRTNLKQAEAWTLRQLTAAIRITASAEPERSKLWLALEEEQSRAPGVANLILKNPMFRKMLESHRRTGAQVHSAISGLAAERFRHDHGDWPKSLGETCPAYLARIPEDPYTGEPLKMRRTNDGVVFYCVGPDGNHAGRYQEEIAAKRTAVSYEFRLWNVPQRRQIVARQP